MKNWKTIILSLLIIAVIGGSSFVLYIFMKPHRDVTTEKSLTQTAQGIYDAFKTNEADANTQYLNKAIDLTGEVVEISTNQDGNKVVNLKTNDPMFVINCTFKTDPGEIKTGQQITFKGICTGYIPDFNVVINEGVLLK